MGTWQGLYAGLDSHPTLGRPAILTLERGLLCLPPLLTHEEQVSRQQACCDSCSSSTRDVDPRETPNTLVGMLLIPGC